MPRRLTHFVLEGVLVAGILLPALALPQDAARKNACLDKDTAETLIDHRFDEVRSRIQNALLEYGVPSISVAVAKSGKIIWEESFGWANREKMIKATPNILYSLASISKPLTATGLMILVEQKLVELGRPVNDYLGQAKLKSYEGTPSTATVRHILNHTAGLPLHWHFFYENEPYRRPSMDETIHHYGIVVAPPGSAYVYSNLGFGIIDYVISRVSHLSYSDFMRTKVFLPLGMTHSSVDVGAGLEACVAQRYDGNQAPIPAYDFDHSGASAIYSSAHDLVRFGMFQLKDHLAEQRPVLKDETVNLMQSETDTTVPDKNYGLGWRIDKDNYGYRTISHNGGMPGVSTTLKLVPSEDIAVVVLCNGSDGRIYTLETEILSAMLPNYAEKVKTKEKEKKAEEKPVKFSPPPSLLGEWSGEIKTYSGVMPLTVAFEPDGDVHVRIKDQLETLLNRVQFKDNILSGVCSGEIQTDDAKLFPHVIQFGMGLKGERLDGFVSAIALKWYALSSWIHLDKKK